MELTLSIEIDREEDGRYIAEVSEMPGVMAYGASQAEAVRAVKVLAMLTLADELEHGDREVASLRFEPIAA